MVRRCFDHGHASINLHEFLTSANGFIKMVSSGGLVAEKCEIWYGPQTHFFIPRDMGDFSHARILFGGWRPASRFLVGANTQKLLVKFF